jgi:hypothetical protein
MTKLEDISIKTKDRALQEHVTELVALWNRGKIGFTKSSSSGPTDSPSDVEFRVYDSGAGTVRLLVFVPGSGQSGNGWWQFGNATEVA